MNDKEKRITENAIGNFGCYLIDKYENMSLNENQIQQICVDFLKSKYNQALAEIEQSEPGDKMLYIKRRKYMVMDGRIVSDYMQQVINDIKKWWEQIDHLNSELKIKDSKLILQAERIKELKTTLKDLIYDHPGYLQPDKPESLKKAEQALSETRAKEQKDTGA